MTPINELITEEQQHHLLNGGEMIYFVIDKVITEWNTIFCEHKGRRRIFYFKKEIIKELSPIQPNTKYYLQENWNYCSIYSGSYIYKQSFLNNYNIKKLVEDMGWKDASEMTEKEARYFFEFDVDIKRIQDLSVLDANTFANVSKELINDEYNFAYKVSNEFIKYHNNLHPNQPYESNPYIITAKVKR